MKLHWYGHACFLLESEDGRLVLDPYAPAYVPGLRLPALQAELCLCSHDHSDHNHSQSVRLTGQPCTMNITRIPCFHDEKGGSLRGQNFLTVVETEGLRIAHAGDLGHPLTQEQRDALGRPDVLLLPIGGTYTLDAAAAARLAKEIGAGLTIPMHYRGEGFGFDVLQTVEDFLVHFDSVCQMEESVLELPCCCACSVAVLRCPVEE